MKKKYTAVGYGSTPEAARQNAKADIQSQITDDEIHQASMDLTLSVIYLGIAALPLIWKVICGYLWAFGIFAKGFFYAPLPSALAALTLLTIPVSIFCIINYGEPSGGQEIWLRIEERFYFIFSLAIMSFITSFIFDRFFFSLAGWFIDKESCAIKRSRIFRAPLTVISSLTPIICFAMFVFNYLGWSSYIASIQNFDWINILVSIFFVTCQFGAISERDSSYPDLDDRTWYGAKKSRNPSASISDYPPPKF